MLDTDQIHDSVRDHYAAAARAVLKGADDDTARASCCEPAATSAIAEILYSVDERAELPDAAVLASLGCGNPIAVAELRPGETVLDLGSGGGIDVLLSARRVGPAGRAIGVDMTDEMLELARRNAVEANIGNVEFVKGTIEALPLPDASVDVVISNCVINLAADKSLVFREIARVLRPGGRMGVSDVVADDSLTPADRAARGDFAGCVAGALSYSEYRAGLEAVGLADIAISPTPGGGDGLGSAIVRAVKPLTWSPADVREPAITLPLARSLPIAETGAGCAEGGDCCTGPGCC